MAQALTQVDLNTLSKYATLGNRYKYWDYLAKLGDSYATLALGVVTNETLAGYVANAYAEAYGITIKNKGRKNEI